jgi:hypothetical protein
MNDSGFPMRLMLASSSSHTNTVQTGPPHGLESPYGYLNTDHEHEEALFNKFIFHSHQILLINSMKEKEKDSKKNKKGPSAYKHSLWISKLASTNYELLKHFEREVSGSLGAGSTLNCGMD